MENQQYQDDIGRLAAEVERLKSEREKLYHLAWKWGIDREEGTYHPDNPPADYGDWARQIVRYAAGIDQGPELAEDELFDDRVDFKL